MLKKIYILFLIMVFSSLSLVAQDNPTSETEETAKVASNNEETAKEVSEVEETPTSPSPKTPFFDGLNIWLGARATEFKGTIRFDFNGIRGTTFDLEDIGFDVETSLIGGLEYSKDNWRFTLDFSYTNVSNDLILANDALVAGVLLPTGTILDADFDFYWIRSAVGHFWDIGEDAGLPNPSDLRLGLNAGVDIFLLDLEFNSGGFQVDFDSYSFIFTLGPELQWSPDPAILLSLSTHFGWGEGIHDLSRGWLVNVKLQSHFYLTDDLYLYLRAEFQRDHQSIEDNDDTDFEPDLYAFIGAAGVGFRF